LQTAGKGGSEDKDGVNGFVFNNVPNPEEIALMISKQQEASEGEKFNEAARAQAKALQTVIGKKSLI
jgi:hypothetical protein